MVIPGDEIWVAAGQYKPTAGLDRTVSYALRNGVNIYGGFAGTETLLSERDPVNNITVLSGDIGQLGESTDNSHSIITANNITTNITVDGFRIMNGYSGASYGGGGLRITNALSGELLLRNCEFLNNYAANTGGAVYLAAAKLRIEQCRFVNNQTGSGGDGGAIHNGNNNGGSSTLTMQDCEFKNNVARRGAVMYNSVTYQAVVIDRCRFTNNTSPIDILHFNGFVTARMSNSYIIGNTISDFSGNVLYVNSSSSSQVFTLTNTTIAHNFNLYANTIQDQMVRFEDSHHVVYNCIIHGNTAVSGRQVNTLPTITHSIIQGGHANGTNNINADPQFTSPYAGAPSNFDATAYDYRPDNSSPAINVGDNSRVLPPYDMDLDGLQRIQGGVVDLGCYESDLNVSVQRVTEQPGALYFDMERRELCITDQSLITGPIEIHDLRGKLQARLTLRQARTRLELPAGVYVANGMGIRPLKFVMH